jgi:5-methylcytosine-specific restriction endonuclease McrA
MLLCHRGCELEATFTNYLGKPCCSPRAPSCPAIKKKIGENSGATRKGKTYEELHGDNADAMRKLRSEKLTGRVVDEKSRKKSSLTNKTTRELNPRDPWNKGKPGTQTAWNKGKTGYKMSPRRQKSEQEYKYYNDYQIYKRAVYSATRKTYKQNITLLNPNGLLLGRCGAPGAYQVDHIVPISLGYKLKISIEIMSIVENLQLMTWEDNSYKSNKHHPDEKILIMLLERTK